MTKLPREVDSVYKLLPLLFSESERGIVISCTAYLEEQIKSDIIKNGKRMSFDSLLRVLGEFLIQKELYNILDIIRDIRNDAAHSYLPFTLKGYGQKYSNNLVSKTKKLEYFQSLAEIPVSLPNGKKGTLGNINSLFVGSAVSSEAVDFVVITSTLSKYLNDALNWRIAVAPLALTPFK